MSPPKDASTTGNGTGASGAVSTINDWIDPTTLETGSDVSVPTMLRATLEAVDVVEQQAADLEEILEVFDLFETGNSCWKRPCILSTPMNWPTLSN